MVIGLNGLPLQQLSKQGHNMESIDKIVIWVSLTGFICLMLIIGVWG